MNDREKARQTYAGRPRSKHTGYNPQAEKMGGVSVSRRLKDSKMPTPKGGNKGVKFGKYGG